MLRDFICSLLLLIVGICYYAAASGLGQTALSDAVGPGGLPRIYGAALVALGIAIGGIAGLRRTLDKGAVPAPDGAGGTPGRARSEGAGTVQRLARGAGTVVVGVVYLVIVPAIGYPFAIALLIAAMAVYQGERPSLRVLLVAAIGAATLFVLFDVVLGVSLPAPWNG